MHTQTHTKTGRRDADHWQKGQTYTIKSKHLNEDGQGTISMATHTAGNHGPTIGMSQSDAARMWGLEATHRAVLCRGLRLFSTWLCVTPLRPEPVQKEPHFKLFKPHNNPPMSAMWHEYFGDKEDMLIHSLSCVSLIYCQCCRVAASREKFSFSCCYGCDLHVLFFGEVITNNLHTRKHTRTQVHILYSTP